MTKSAAKDEIIATAIASLQLAREQYADMLSKRDEILALQIENRLFDKSLLSLWIVSKNLLTLGQVTFVIERDVERAAAYFHQLKDWLPYFDRSIGAQMPVDASSGKPVLFNAQYLLEPLICSLLSGNKDMALWLAGGDDLSFLGRKELNNAGFNLTLMSMDIRKLIRGETDTEIGAREEKLLKFKTMVVGYERLVRAISNDDSEAFNSGIADLEKQYRARGKNRGSGLDEYGYGKLGQATSIDVLGTALCRLAVWRGLEVAVESELYPNSFWSR